MTKHLTDSDIENIAKLIGNWDKDAKFTWDRLVDRNRTELGIECVRQTLEKSTRIYNAYLDLKDSIRNGRNPKPKTFGSLAIAEARIERLESDNARLKREMKNLLEQFRVWQYNAYANGLAEHQLNAPLPPKNAK